MTQPAMTPAHRLNEIATLLRDHPRRNLAEVIAVGELLLQAKRLIGHGGWRSWLQGNWPHSPTLAKEAMRASRITPTQMGACAHLDQLGPSAIRVIANGQLSARERGRVLTRTPGHRNVIGPARALMNTLDADNIGAFVPTGDEEPATMPPNASAAEMTLASLDELLADGTVDMIHISRDGDEEAPLLTVAVFGPSHLGRPVCHVRAGILGLLQAAAGIEVARICPNERCGKRGQLQPPEAFGKGAVKCKRCEVKRVGRAKARQERRRASRVARAAKRAAGRQPATTP